MSEIKTATVSQINNYIKRILDNNSILNNVWVKGEISNFKHHYSGHMYITLKDENSVLKAVMFRGENKSLTFEPKDGMKVLARGRVGVYEASGAYQLYIEEMQQDGIGDLYAAFERLKKKLSAEGIFDEEHKKPIPAFPEKIGVCTATTGAAVRDIINVITRRFPYCEIIIYPTIVQGENAAASIVSGIEYFNSSKSADVIIAGRGGGSIEDLWAFNEEMVARAIYNSQIPIISAVGHETDFTIADFAADLRAPTPSAAAEIAVPSSVELYSRLSMLDNKLLKSVSSAIERRRLILDSLRLKSPKEIIGEYSMKTDALVQSLENSLNVKLINCRRELSQLAGALNAMSPLAVLERGYAVAVADDGHILKKAACLKSGTEFNLKLNDGEKRCRAI
ncbi:MAG: exodeoxyribonuclease VII large subunit [Clostridia bacterium]|nr:exodeoxyribonuclease VII large subunit [Clostridia bacterium]